MIRKAAIHDTNAIFDLMTPFVIDQRLLPRNKSTIRQEIDLTWVCEKNFKVVGCINLTLFGANLYEVRALAVNENCSGLGIGGDLLTTLESYMKRTFLAPMHLFALTYQADFFLKYGFQITSKDKFPQKVYEVCQYCTRKDDCQEVAVAKMLP